MKKILIRIIQALALGSLIGSVVGAVRAIATISSNDYFRFDLEHVAAKELFAEILEGTVEGLLLSAAIVVVVIAAYPVFRLLKPTRDRAWGWTLITPVVLGLLIGGYHVNHRHLPGFFTWPSILANAITGLLCLGILFVVAKLIQRHAGASGPWMFLSKTAILGVPTVLIALFLARSAQWLFPPSPSLDSRPNILVILIDTLRADHMSAYGHFRETTPNLDRLAADGMLFTQAISHAGWTKPAVASLFTGMYPRQHGIVSSEWGVQAGPGGQKEVQTLSQKVLTIAELLSNAGYYTAGIGNNDHLMPEIGFDQGFDYYFMDIEKDEYYTRSTELNRRYLRWMNQHNDVDFFLYLHYIHPHWPYISPPPFQGMYAGPPLATDYNRPRWQRDTNALELEEFDPELLKHILAAYDEGIRFVDHKIGEVIDDLKKRGLYDEMMIVVLADHGEEFREHGTFGHGQALYDELLRVPLIIKFPDPDPELQKQVITTQVETIDVMPTILNQIGLTPPAGLFGRDVLASSPDPEPAAFSEQNNRVALRTLQHKYIYDFDSGDEELYELTTDPTEQHDLATDRPELAKEFRSRLFSWVEVVDTGLSVTSDHVELDEDSKKKLEALGYVD